MAAWVYFASKSGVSRAETVRIIVEENVLVRSAHNEKGSLIANVGRLSPGELIALVYRGSGATKTELVARIGLAQISAIPGTKVVEHVGDELSERLAVSGYPTLEGGGHDVLRIQQVTRARVDLSGSYAGRNAIHKLEREDLLRVRAALEPEIG